MPHLSVREAAKLAGKDRSTILRAIDHGRLSATRDEHSRFRIDPAELERAFGQLYAPAVRTAGETDALPHPAPADLPRTATLEREVELLREMLSMHERERQGWEEERAFLRNLVETQAAQVKLLTDQREQAPRSGFWQRMLGRA
jgi:excisionase family DNA binding protein